MVAADLAVARIGEAKIDKVMAGDITAPSTPKRDALFDRIERATRSTESTVQIFLAMGQSVAVGTAIGSGMDPVAVDDRAHKSGEASRPGLEDNMRVPMRRFVAYGYRDLSDSDLEHLLSFVESPAGQRYIAAYNAAMGAGFIAMGRRTGEQLGESLRELAQAQMAPPPVVLPPPGIASPPATPPH
jgi:phosphate/sulfate permease